MKLLKRIIVTFLVLILFACGGGGGGGDSSGGGGSNTSTVLPNGSVVSVAQSSISSFTGGVTSNTISVSGGTAMPVTIDTNTQVQSFNVTANGKLLSDTGIKVTTSPSPLVLISGSQNSGQIIIDATKASTGNYLVNVYGAFTNPNTGLPDSMLVAQFSVVITLPTPSDIVPGVLSISPSIVNLNESNGKISNLTVSLDGSQNIKNLSVSVNSDNSEVTVSKSECILSSTANTCQVAINGTTSTKNLATISARATGYTAATSVIHINNPQPIIVYGTISVVPTSLSIFPTESSNFIITWSGSENLNELPISITKNNNLVGLDKNSCVLTPTNNSCVVNVTGIAQGSTNLTLQVSNSELAPHYPVQNVAVEVGQQAYGNLSLAPASQAISVGESGNLLLTWSDSHGINALPVTVTTSQNNIQLNTTSCNLTPQNNSCNISFSGITAGSSVITVIPTNPEQVSHFTSQTALVQVAAVLHNQLLIAMNGLPRSGYLGSMSLLYNKDQSLVGNNISSLPGEIYNAYQSGLVLRSTYGIYKGNTSTGQWNRLGRSRELKPVLFAVNATADKITIYTFEGKNNTYGLYSYASESNNWILIPGSNLFGSSVKSIAYRESDLYALVTTNGYYVTRLVNGSNNWESFVTPTSLNQSHDALLVDKQNNLYFTTVSSNGQDAGPVVYKLNPLTNSWTKLIGNGPDGSIARVPAGYVQYLTSDSQGNLYVNVFDGHESLYKYIAATQQWERFGYQSPSYYQGDRIELGVPTIAIDSNDILYLTSNDGIYKISSADNWKIVIGGVRYTSIMMSGSGLMNFRGAISGDYTNSEIYKQATASDWDSSSLITLGPKGMFTRNSLQGIYLSSFGQSYILGNGNYDDQDPSNFTLARWDVNNNKWENKYYSVGDGLSVPTAMSTTSSGLLYLGLSSSSAAFGYRDARLLSITSWFQPFNLVQQTTANKIELLTSDSCGNSYFVTYASDGSAGIRDYYQINASGEILPMSSPAEFDSSVENTLTTDYACNVYVGTQAGGIYRHNSTSPLSKWQLVVGIPNTPIKKILFNHSNQMYMMVVASYENNKIAYYQNNQIVYLKDLPETYDNKTGTGVMSDFAITYDGSLYAGTNNVNVWQYDFVNSVWVYTKYGNGMGDSISISAN